MTASDLVIDILAELCDNNKGDNTGIKGKLVYRDIDTKDVDVEHLTVGLCFIKILGEGSSFTYKFVKE